MIVKIYIDERGTHGSPVVIIGGWVGRLGEWATFDDKWKRLLRRESLSYFHSKEMRNGKNEFKGWPHLRKRNFMSNASRLALKGLSFGFTITVKMDEYKKYYIGEERLKGVMIDSSYGLCFRYCLGIVTTLAIEHYNCKDLDVHFVLESGHKNLGDAERIFHEVRETNWPAPEVQKVKGTLRTILSGDKKKYPGLQIADVNAYSAFQYETRDNNLELVSLPNESTVQAAKKIQKVPIFHLPLSQSTLTQFRGLLLEQLEEKRGRRKAVI